jgi:hypothetical protein
MNHRKLPDFSGWATSRLKFILADYQLALQTANRKRYFAEIRLYDSWVRAMEAEIKKREDL